jgi:ribosomal protein S27AE
MSEPRTAAQRRPNDRPYYIKHTCDKCGDELVYADLLSMSNTSIDEIWYDEFMCPNCRDGVYMDWPHA